MADFRAIYVPMTTETFERLKILARIERRSPKDQAAVLLEGVFDLLDDLGRTTIPELSDLGIAGPKDG